jgi:hypothetical protein
MLSIAHIVNPVKIDPSRDLYFAQPVTLETMRLAREAARSKVDVELFEIQFQDDERHSVPDCFRRAPDLTRSVLDHHSFKHDRKLPFLKDVLDALFPLSQADIFIYSHVDISLQPYFYLTVAEIYNRGYDAFIVNRRTITDAYTEIKDIPLMYAEAGEKHPGWDCFLFSRSLYPQFVLGEIIIGAGWIGRAMITNMACLAECFKIFTDLHLTFHIGDLHYPKSTELIDYRYHNIRECQKILHSFDKSHGPLDRNRIPGKYFQHLEQWKDKI